MAGWHIGSFATVCSDGNIRIPLLYSDGQEILSLQAQMRVPSSQRPGSRAYINEAIGLAGLR